VSLISLNGGAVGTGVGVKVGGLGVLVGRGVLVGLGVAVGPGVLVGRVASVALAMARAVAVAFAVGELLVTTPKTKLAQATSTPRAATISRLRPLRRFFGLTAWATFVS